ncbi:MAG: ribosome small subunit-dependent GTPase A [Clostridia bacterium]|nr:ribosome small subunit-dependent GTPase A [Clostridia bacterium]
MLEGILLRGRGGFYDVQSNGDIWRCTLRGKHRWFGREILPGDRVRFQPLPGQQGTIEEVLPRQTRLVRPAVANVRQVIVVMSLALPPVNWLLLDRLLVTAEAAGVAPVIVFNKVDLVTDAGPLVPLYRDLGYSVMLTSAVTLVGIEQLRHALQHNISVFAGPSGVGKSSLLNAVQPGLRLKTAAVSEKIARGRHTTRHVELLPLPGGALVADTPGFTQLTLPAMKREELAYFFPEMAARASGCRFTNCLHQAEPGCAVRQAVEAGEINRQRYAHYLEFLEEVMQAERRY